MKHHKWPESPLPIEADSRKERTSYYWSSTTSMYESRYAWVLYMRDGAVGVGFKPLSEFFFGL